MGEHFGWIHADGDDVITEKEWNRARLYFMYQCTAIDALSGPARTRERRWESTVSEIRAQAESRHAAERHFSPAEDAESDAIAPTWFRATGPWRSSVS